MKAMMPETEIGDLIIEIRSATAGVGTFTSKFDHMAELTGRMADPSLYGDDRFFIDIRTEGEDDASHDDRLKALEAAGHPVVRIVMKSIDHIGQEFFRFEMATAVAGAARSSASTHATAGPAGIR